MPLKHFIFVQDNDCHWYIIPLSKKPEWDRWRNIPGDDEKSWDLPTFAKEVDGPHRVAFRNYEVLFS